MANNRGQSGSGQFSLSTKHKKGNEIFDNVKLDKLPKFSILVDEVNNLVANSSWWDRYGIDWMINVIGLILCSASFWLLSFDISWCVVLGMVCLGLGHAILSTKGGHVAAHGAAVQSPRWSKFWLIVFIEFFGSFSAELGNEIHIKSHHPHTNIIGQGDSSTWKAPFVPAYIYMFLTPLLVPVLTPMVAIAGLFGRWTKLAQCVFVITLGLAVNLYLLVFVSGFSFPKACFVLFVCRSMLSIPYIHVNIFQHIGLPMYSQENRPKKIYQMSTGVLNLDRNRVLDPCFGHSLISCHVEHHLFPKLSDNMCLKIKPLVSKFLRSQGLPYNEATYISKVWYFIEHYKELMVNAPPITHFVGLQ